MVTVERAGASPAWSSAPRGRLRAGAACCRDLGPLYAANGFIGLIFSATGPVAVILAVGTQGGLSPAELASWVFGVFFLNGVLTVVAAGCTANRWRSSGRSPARFWSARHSATSRWPEVVGAFFATGLLMLRARA